MNTEALQIDGRHDFTYTKDGYRTPVISPLNMLPQDQYSILNIIAERDAAIEERNQAFLDRDKIFQERHVAIIQRNIAIQECNHAILQRNNAFTALEQSLMNNKSSPPQPKTKGRPKVNPEKLMPIPENVRLMNGFDYGQTLMPVPGCTCTGVFRQCYKWGNGGWQSSCCTTMMSVFPLPVVPNKRYGRMGGRKMSGSAFSKLLNRLVLGGFDLSSPVDLKEHWSKHGTNRYVTIK